MTEVDCAIIGAGGAGMMAALIAAKRGRRVLLLDHSEKIGRKILISGGGRCNFTNIHCSPANFVSANPHFCKSALAQYTPQHFLEMVERHNIRYHEKKLGQLFCDQSAKQIVDMLVDECQNAGVEFTLGCSIAAIEKEKGFRIRSSAGVIQSETLVVATGGLSIPQIGATGFGYDIARQFGLKIVETAPALDGFLFRNEDLDRFADLTGVSVDTIVNCGGSAFRENILFTHSGLSGPASLQASLYWQPGQPIGVNLIPEQDALHWLRQKRQSSGAMEIKNVIGNLIPKRLAEKLCSENKVKGPLAEQSDELLCRVALALNAWEIWPKGTVGYRKAEVTRGGIDTNELSSKTLESKKVPGLHFVGEVVDVTGQLGGYNFQWAWASGFCAGNSV